MVIGGWHVECEKSNTPFLAGSADFSARAEISTDAGSGQNAPSLLTPIKSFAYK